MVHNLKRVVAVHIIANPRWPAPVHKPSEQYGRLNSTRESPHCLVRLPLGGPTA